MIWVRLDNLRRKVGNAGDLRGIVPGDWDIERVWPIELSIKFVSIRQHFVDGRPWEETGLFNRYRQRFAKGARKIRGCTNIEQLIEQYYGRVADLFESMKRDGFLLEVEGKPVPLPTALISRRGEVLGGSGGNHRVAMAKIIGLEEIPMEIVCRHGPAQ